MRRVCVLFIFILGFSSPVFAWKSAGHRIIAYIAYQQLTPAAREQIDHITAVKFHSPYPLNRFMRAATWPDSLRVQGDRRFDNWHFINMPYVKGDRTKLRIAPIYSHNVVWAIGREQQQLQKPAISLQQQAIDLSFLVHVVGDVHQPLHCTTLYSTRFPTGDRGGNYYSIRAGKIRNLHQYWDNGAGLYRVKHDGYLGYYQVKKIADRLMQMYPRQYFQKQLADHQPIDWAKASNQLARRFAYVTPYGATPSRAYEMHARQVIAKQLTLAGYRLATILNRVYH